MPVCSTHAAGLGPAIEVQLCCCSAPELHRLMPSCVLQFDDQGLLNTDPRTIAVPESYINNIPTDIRGVSFSRTPAMVCLLCAAY